MDSGGMGRTSIRSTLTTLKRRGTPFQQCCCACCRGTSSQRLCFDLEEKKRSALLSSFFLSPPTAVPRSFVFNMTLTLPSAILTLISRVPLCPFVHAQRFRTIATAIPCSTYVEGQGRYAVGGTDEDMASTTQALVFDLYLMHGIQTILLKDGPQDVSLAIQYV